MSPGLQHRLPSVRQVIGGCRLSIRHKSKSSTLWLSRQKTDHHTIQSKTENYRSRAAYKLIEIDDKFKLFDKKSKNILDLGFAPGAWTQVAIAKMKAKNLPSKILGVDLILCSPPLGSSFIQGDVFSKKTHEEILDFFDSDNEPAVDVILSDMMANTSGIKDSDHYASMDLCDAVLILQCKLLKKNGKLLMKFYTGKEENLMQEKLFKVFNKVYKMKPSACRSELREMYFICIKKKSTNIRIDEIFRS